MNKLRAAEIAVLIQTPLLAFLIWWMVKRGEMLAAGIITFIFLLSAGASFIVISQWRGRP